MAQFPNHHDITTIKYNAKKENFALLKCFFCPMTYDWENCNVLIAAEIWLIMASIQKNEYIFPPKLYTTMTLHFVDNDNRYTKLFQKTP